MTGSVSGHLYVWRGRRCEKIIRAHESNVTTLYATETGVVSGGGDGFVKLYSSSLEHLRSYGLHEAQVPPLRSGVKAVCAGLDKDGVNITKIVVATESAEVYELAKDSGNWTLLSEGHYSKPEDGAGGELWGLAPHPTNPDIFATSGDDATVRIWSISQGRLLRKAQLDCATRCVNWNPTGTRLLVGLGGSCRGVRQKKDGAFMMLHAETLEVLYEGRDARHWLREVKYSPDGQSFACASQDQKVYLYDNRQNILRAKCDKHNSYVTSLDFSDDGAYVQSDAGDFEHLYHSATDGQYFKLPSQLKNVRWFSWSCIYGWPVQGIWPTINVERDTNDPLPPDPTSCHRSSNQDLVAVGYQDGQGRVFRYPCVTKAAQSIPLTGHTADMPAVRFMCDDTHLVTIGKADRAICVWKITR